MVMKTSTIVGILVGVVIFTSLLPTIADQVAGIGGNVSGAALVLIGLIPLFVVIGFVVKLTAFAKTK